MLNWDRNRKHAKSILDAIGYTPLVRLNRVSAEVKPEILVKLEYFSPSGSLKDRIYLNMIEKAERRGDLKKGMTILECSTGNAGIACSFVAAVKGYSCIIVMPEGMSEERKKMNVAYGTLMVYTPGGESDVDLALAMLEDIRSKEPGRYWVPSQFDNPDNIQAHYKTTGPEIWEQTRGQLHHADDVRAIVGDSNSQIRSQLLAFGNLLALQVTGKTDPAEVKTLIDTAVRKVLLELRKYNPRDYYRRSKVALALIKEIDDEQEKEKAEPGD